MSEVIHSSPTDILQFKPSRKMLGSEVAISRLMSFITTVPDPDEMLAKAGIKRYQLRQLELDDEVAQCLDTRREAVVATPWRLEPNQNRVGKFLTSLIEPHIEDLKRGVLDARFYGYSVFEIIYKQVEKGIGIDRLMLKPIEWFQPQRDGTLKYFPDDGSGGSDGLDCDPLKFLLSRCNASYRNPYGEALLSRLWFPVTWRREGWTMWLNFLETFGEPIILGQVRNYKDFVEAMVAQGVRSTVAWESIDGEDKVQPITASTPGEFDRLEAAILRRIQKLILGQTLTSDVGSNGSYAVAAIHNEVRNDKRRADMRMVQRTGQQLVNNLAMINGLEPPKFIMADDSGLEMSRAQRDSILLPVLAASGFRFTEKYLYDRYDIEVGDLEEKIVESVDNPVDNNGDEVADKTMPTKDNLNDNGETKEPTRNRSVADEKMMSELFALAMQERREPPVMHFTNEINLPEGMVKSDPVSIQLHQEPSPVQVHITTPEVPAPIVNVQAAVVPAPIVNVTTPESSVIVNVPLQETPIVNVESPTIHFEAPDIQVTPEIKVQLGTRKTVTEIERDSYGMITKTEQIESDVSDNLTSNPP